MNKTYQRAIKLSKKRGGWWCEFRKGWAMIWPELEPYIEAYRTGSIKGGTRWFQRYAPTKKEAWASFYSEIQSHYLLNEDKPTVIFVL